MELPFLQQARIATPCPASWEDMRGDDRMRFCDQCSLHVYNVSELNQDEAERLIRETEGRLCGRIYRRADGTIMTRDCPVGLRAVRRRAARIVGRIAATVVFAAGLLGVFRSVAGGETGVRPLDQVEPFTTIQRWLDPDGPSGLIIMGEMVLPPPQNTTGQP